MAKTTVKSPLIKGYLPLRVVLPSKRETFLFLKQHNASTSPLNQMDNNSLFVCNVPFVPHVRTTIFLTALFKKFGAVEKVTVVRNPRKINNPNFSDTQEKGTADTVGQRWHDMLSKAESLFPENDVNDEGKYAHVRFSSSAEMKNALRRMQQIYNGSEDAGVKITLFELQDMKSQSENPRYSKNNAPDCDIESSELQKTSKSREENQSPVISLADRYRAAIIPRDVLMDCCNAVMESFESAEEKARINSKLLAEPDEDGFITVTHSIPSKMVGSKRELEVDGGMITRSNMADGRRSGHNNKKIRTRKKSSGASELNDFYRFQRRETRQKGLHELRKRFEDDLEAVKKVREQKMYRPFQN